ncbi:MAG: hypothetical protein NC818_04070 [Candidatus Omnitrophica bacterium]|nr:hypothetical protein [Candidatus Omnitrophota bacterium]
MRIKKELTLLLIALFLLGMASQPQKVNLSEKIDKTLVEAILSQLESAYEREDILGFKELIYKDFENYLGFISKLENYFYSVKFLNLYLILDTFLIDKDKVLVKIHWFKKTIDNSGAFSKSRGTAELAFKNTPQGLKLLYIRKDNPFF